MKKLVNNIYVFLALLVVTTACDVQEFDDLNGPEVESFEQVLTRGDLQDLVGGIFYSTRDRLGTYLDDCGVLGREYWRFSSSDPRFTGDLLGGGNAVLDNNTFYITGPWGSRYRTVKNANLILGFLDNATGTGEFSDAEISATRGFLRTFIAYELLLNLNLTDEGGIRLDVADEDNLGPFVSKTEALQGIRSILEQAITDLNQGGDFPFPLTGGFAGFDTPDTFAQATNALAARVAAYQNDASGTLSFLNNSFLNLSAGDLNTGIYHVFSADPTDFLNPMFFPITATTAGARVMQPSFLTDGETGDARLSKVQQRAEPLTLDDLTGDYLVFVYNSNTDPIAIVRNEELILLYAEANITVNPIEAVSALNIVRNSAGLGDYTGATDQASLVNEMLNQRRYSLYAEGHRWVDVRRYGRLSELPIDRPEDDVFSQFPIPLTENQ